AQPRQGTPAGPAAPGGLRYGRSSTYAIPPLPTHRRSVRYHLRGQGAVLRHLRQLRRRARGA
ncbi:unnamed protein product, partial [Prorocentrum cordatum]